MIAFFPEPYPDELAYSLFARYHIHSGHLTFRATAEDLFQNKDAIPNPEFFAPLTDEVCSILARNSNMETFIAGHTMFPYYTRFLPLERRRKAMDLLLAMDRTFYDAIYVRQKKSERRLYMRFRLVTTHLKRRLSLRGRLRPWQSPGTIHRNAVQDQRLYREIPTDLTVLGMT